MTNENDNGELYNFLNALEMSHRRFMKDIEKQSLANSRQLFMISYE